jgi:uracil-DNA glycosylase
MPRKKLTPHDWPSLNEWLYSVGITGEDIECSFLYSALVDYFPGAENGSHIVPSKGDIKNERGRLGKDLVAFDPKVIVPVGKLSVTACLGGNIRPLNELVGNWYMADPYGLLDNELPIIPLPHPSGASTWTYANNHRELLDAALQMLHNAVMGGIDEQ